MIGGNTEAILQVSTAIDNEIGEPDYTWHDVMPFKGWLDLSGGDSKYTTYNAKMQESTHVFVCDYKPIPEALEVNGEMVEVTAENARMVAKSQAYDVLLIDNPMELDEQLEFYLKFTGGQ